jgi:hypothetical protein
MCMVRSPKSIGGIFGLALGNAPYSYSYWNNSLQGKRILPIIEKINLKAYLRRIYSVNYRAGIGRILSNSKTRIFFKTGFSL